MMKLVLNNFRLYKHKDFLFEEFPVLIVGPNGSGKTSVLEGLYLLSTTKSFRTQRKKDLIRYRKKEAYLGLKTKTEEREIVFRLGQSNLYRLNRKKVKRIEFISHFFVSLFWWGDFRLVYGSPAERRRMLNLFCLQAEPRYLFWLAKYKKVVRARNLALTQENLTLVDVWSEKMVDLATKIWRTRKRVLQRLNQALNPVLDTLYPSQSPGVIHYQGDFFDAYEFKKRLQKGLAEEVQRHRTLVGPHLDDLSFVWGNRPLGNYSQGEIKIFLLALKLAFLYTLKGERLFLIDDAFSGLDEGCQKRLVDFLRRNHIPLILSHQKKIEGFDWQIIQLK